MRSSSLGWGQWTGFQSLSGFQVRCNTDIGVFQFSGEGVSIPIGFSSSLQPPVQDRLPPKGLGFNPYRVFKFVATDGKEEDQENWLAGFNPYRVFKFVATLTIRFRLFMRTIVSIPIGFSSSLQLESTFHEVTR